METNLHWTTSYSILFFLYHQIIEILCYYIYKTDGAVIVYMHNSQDNMKIEDNVIHENENINYFTNCLLNGLRGINMGGDKIMKYGGKA